MKSLSCTSEVLQEHIEQSRCDKFTKANAKHQYMKETPVVQILQLHALNLRKEVIVFGFINSVKTAYRHFSLNGLTRRDDRRNPRYHIDLEG